MEHVIQQYNGILTYHEFAMYHIYGADGKVMLFQYSTNELLRAVERSTYICIVYRYVDKVRRRILQRLKSNFTSTE